MPTIVPTKTAELQLLSSYHGHQMPDGRALRIGLLTAGDPSQRTGGHLYNRRMVEAAASHAALVSLVAMPARPYPLGVTPVTFRPAGVGDHDILVIDSIIAADCGPWLRRSGGLRIVGLVHQVPGGVDGGPFRRAIRSRLDRFAYRRARRLIVVSDYLADCLARSGFDRNRIAVVPPGRDLAGDETVITKSDLRQGRQIAVLTVSNWLRNKGIHFLLEALAGLPGKIATLHLVGDDRPDPRYARRLRAQIADPGLSPRVVVHGSLDATTLKGLYSGADVFVLPSLREAYGTVCAEAMAQGLAVIASRTDNLPYLVRDGIDGILVKPGDVDGLALAVAKLAGDPELRRSLGSSARQRALALPTWEQSADRFFTELRQVAFGS
jgi:glycosyltransferase involved in cell wall biosynthesis